MSKILVFQNTNYVLPTSNIYERLFSKSGYCLNSRRRRVFPRDLEPQIFLHANEKYWKISDISEVLSCVSGLGN